MLCPYVCVSVHACTLELTTVSDALSIQDGPEERDAVEGLVHPEHVLGCYPPVLVRQLPVADVGRVSSQRERETSNVSSSKHILICLHKLGREGEGRRRQGGDGGGEGGGEGKWEGRGGERGEEERRERRGGGDTSFLAPRL